MNNLSPAALGMSPVVAVFNRPSTIVAVFNRPSTVGAVCNRASSGGSNEQLINNRT